MLKKLMTVLAVFIATLMLFSCQQPDNTPTEKTDPNIPEKIYRVPEVYNSVNKVLRSTVGGMDFYYIEDTQVTRDAFILLSFLHDADPETEQMPVTAEKLYVTDASIKVQEYVTKENIYDSQTDMRGFIGSLQEIYKTKNLYETDSSKAENSNYAGWMAIVPADPKSADTSKAKISDSIYVKYWPDSGYDHLNGEKNNISTLTGYGTWTIYTDYKNLKDVLPKMSESTQKIIFGKTL